jgi:hypothetical protein
VVHNSWNEIVEQDWGLCTFFNRPWSFGILGCWFWCLFGSFSRVLFLQVSAESDYFEPFATFCTF